MGAVQDSRAGTAGVALVVVSAACFGVQPILARLAYAAGMGVPAVLTYRFAVAVPLFWLALAVARRRVRMAGRDALLLFLLGAIGYAAFSTMYFEAVDLIPAAAAAGLLYAYPTLVAVSQAGLGRERVTGRLWLALAGATAGTLLVLGASAQGLRPLGTLLAIGAALGYTVYLIVGHAVLARVPPLPATAVMTTGAAFTLTGLAVIQGQASPPASPTGWLAVAGLAVLTTVVAVLALFAGMARIGPTRASVLNTVEPLVTAATAALVLGERLRMAQYLGIALIVAAAAAASRAAAGSGRSPGWRSARR
jgi:drug/metabolite transporter (DMT)-like permease